MYWTIENQFHEVCNQNTTLLFLYNKMCLRILSALWWSFCLSINVLTHWGRVTHIYVSKLTIIGSDNGLSPDRRQAIIWTNAGMWLIGPLGTNFSEILIGIQIFSFKKMPLKMSSVKWRPFCLGLNVLTHLDLKVSRNWNINGSGVWWRFGVSLVPSHCLSYWQIHLSENLNFAVT